MCYCSIFSRLFFSEQKELNVTINPWTSFLENHRINDGFHSIFLLSVVEENCELMPIIRNWIAVMAELLVCLALSYPLIVSFQLYKWESRMERMGTELESEWKVHSLEWEQNGKRIHVITAWHLHLRDT
jgi:hypothetical protein